MIRDCWNSIGIAGDTSCPELTTQVHCRNCPAYSAAASELLAALPDTDGIDDRTEHFARPVQAHERASMESAVVFRLGTEWLGLPTSCVVQVTRASRVHSIPNRRSPAVLGVVNVGGELIVCASLASLLQVDASQAEPVRAESTGRVLVIRRERVRAACPVDDVHGVVRFQARELRDAPPTVAGASASYVGRVLEWEGKFVGLIDAERLFPTLQRSLA